MKRLWLCVHIFLHSKDEKVPFIPSPPLSLLPRSFDIIHQLPRNLPISLIYSPAHHAPTTKYHKTLKMRESRETTLFRCICVCIIVGVCGGVWELFHLISSGYPPVFHTHAHNTSFRSNIIHIEWSTIPFAPGCHIPLSFLFHPMKNNLKSIFNQIKSWGK